MNYSTPCVTEDSIDCTWNAPTMGNGQGQSFVNIGGTVHPILGCAVNEGLPAVDVVDGAITLVYCEPALGNYNYVEPVPTGEPVPSTPTETVGVQVNEDASTLAVTGADDVSPLALILGVVLVVAGIATKIGARRA